MRRIGMCCALSMLVFVGVGRAAPVGPHRAPTAAGPAILLGDQTIRSTVGQVSAGQAEAFPFAVRRAGTVTAASIYVDAQSKAKALVVAVYASRSGQPVRRVASGTLSSPKAGAWNKVSVSRATVRSRNRYWVAVLARGGALYFRDAKKGSCEGQSYPSFRLASLPRLWAEGTRLPACSISAYATGAVATTASGPTLTFGTLAPANPTAPTTNTTVTTTPATSGAPASTNPTSPALPQATLPPVNIGAPTVTGTPVQGNTLTTSTGSWINDPRSYAYQWQDCNGIGVGCTNISGAKSSSYTLQASDVGSTIRSVVTATNKGGSASASSAATSTVTAAPPAAPTVTAAPVVSGQAVQGQTLSTSNGSWTGSPTSYAYKWQDCDSSGANCVNISGATSSNYTLQASDVGSTIRSVVTATNAGGSTPASSAATSTVTATPPAAPTVTAAPVVSGQTVQGQTLSTSNGSWTGSPTSYAYRWQDCNSSGASCVNISGATSSNYTLQASDVGSTIRSVVTATNAGGSTPASSAATATVTAPPPPAAPTNTAPPAVSGQAVQGQTLSTSNGSWTGSPTSYAYKWQDCDSSGANCVNISGATSSSYTLQAGDVGSTIRSMVTATNAGGSTPASSAATGVVSSSGGGGGSVSVGAPTPSGLTCTQTLNAGANVQSAVSAASPGSVVCLNAGSWSAITLSSIAPAAPGVTVAATPGQTVSVPGFTITGTTQNLTVEGFNMTSGAGNGHGNGIDLLCQINGGVTLTHNTIENISGGDAIHAYAGACGGGGTQTGVSITYNQLDHAATFVEVQGNSCACASADANWTISHNVMGPDENYGGAGHYIQGQWLGATIDNNAFEGPTVFNSNAHNNVLHCYTTNAPGCQNITFDNNIIWHAQSRAQTILISDNNLTNIHIDNNLDIDDPVCGQTLDCPASPWFVEKGYGFMLMHNTSVGAVWSVNMGTCGDGCITNPNNWDAEYNIAVGTPQSGQNNYGTWQCQSTCTLGHNTSQDGSASSDWGGTSNVNSWTPAWQTTNWTPVSGPGYQPPPTGYYQPTGLSISGAGYQGQIGP